MNILRPPSPSDSKVGTRRVETPEETSSVKPIDYRKVGTYDNEFLGLSGDREDTKVHGEREYPGSS